jgi:hypothetical protein
MPLLQLSELSAYEINDQASIVHFSSGYPAEFSGDTGALAHGRP